MGRTFLVCRSVGSSAPIAVIGRTLTEAAKPSLVAHPTRSRQARWDGDEGNFPFFNSFEIIPPATRPRSQHKTEIIYEPIVTLF